MTRRKAKRRLSPNIDFWFFRNGHWERFIIPRASRVVIDERTVFREKPK
jgi:hypothetical protein